MSFLLGLISSSKSIGCLMQVAIYNPIDILGHEALFPSRYPPQLVGRCFLAMEGHVMIGKDEVGVVLTSVGHPQVDLLRYEFFRRETIHFGAINYRHSSKETRICSYYALELCVTTSIWSSLHWTLMQTQVLSCTFHPV